MFLLIPAFDKVQVAHFKPALEQAMEQTRREIAVIADNTAAPDFENTIAALDDAGRTLDSVSTIYGVWASTMNGPEFQAIVAEFRSLNQDPKKAHLAVAEYYIHIAHAAVNRVQAAVNSGQVTMQTGNTITTMINGVIVSVLYDKDK